MGGAGGGTGSPQACQQCGQQQCGTEVQQCFGAGFQECQAWLNCSQACQDKACLDDCSAMHPAGAPVETCICQKCNPGDCSFICN